ncbi:MAG: CBM96 family carbohydrate-binding protein, partial [Serratia proteamaculans]
RLDNLNISKADLRLYGRQVSGETGQVRLYALAEGNWDENEGGHALTHCPSAAPLDHAQMWSDSVQKTFNVTAAVMLAIQTGQREINFCLSGGEATDAEFSSKEGPRSPVLRFNFSPVTNG